MKLLSVMVAAATPPCRTTWVLVVATVFLVNLVAMNRHATSSIDGIMMDSSSNKNLGGIFFDPDEFVVYGRRRRLNTVSNKLDNNNNNNNYNNELVVVRPFATHDASSLASSFQRWYKYLPCDTTTTTTTGPNNSKADLVLSFSQTLNDHPDIEKLVDLLKHEFDAKHGWSKCFDNFFIYESEIDSSQDIYEKGENRSSDWVIGPNLQFQRTFNAMVAAQYKTMIIMEKDTKPQVHSWLNLLQDEVETKSPFAVLGSKYRGNSWDNCRDQLSLSLLDHLNGNAIYNLSHPFLRHMVHEMEDEMGTPLKQVPYDVRMSQMVVEGSLGIPPDLPVNNSFGWTSSKQIEGIVDRVLHDESKSHKLKMWWERYGKEDNPMKETSTIRNMHINDYLPRHVEGGVLVHGAKEYRPWDKTKHQIGLVVTGWGDASLPKEFKQSLVSSNSHPFTELLVMQDYNGTIKIEQGLTIPTWRVIRNTDSISTMDLCDAPIQDSEWFMMTNTYHKLASNVDIMTTQEPSFKPVIHSMSAEHCDQHSQCRHILEDARRFYPPLDKVVLDFDMIYHVPTRNAFCEAWRGLEANIASANTTTGHHSLGMPTAASYVAYLYNKQLAEDMYLFSDKSIHGSFDAFIPLSSRSSHPKNESVAKPTISNIVKAKDTLPAVLDSPERRRFWRQMENDFQPQNLPISCEDLDSIQLIRRLGEGQRKMVDEGRWKSTEVVVKKPKDSSYYKDQKERKSKMRAAMKEAFVLYQLRNASNVMHMLGWCNYTMVVGGVMKMSLVDLISDTEGIMTPRRKLEVSLDVARGIQQIHELGVIHNDIKPSHFFVDSNGKVFLDDFDMVRYPNLGVPEFRCSSNQFRPPEEFTGIQKDLSSDIYGLSLVLWCVWSGLQGPYKNWDEDKCHAVGENWLRPNVTLMGDDCPETMKQLMVQSWDHDPTKRPTASQIVSYLESILE